MGSKTARRAALKLKLKAARKARAKAKAEEALKPKKPVKPPTYARGVTDFHELGAYTQARAVDVRKLLRKIGKGRRVYLEHRATYGSGDTALINHARRSSHEVVAALLKAGADPNGHNRQDGNTALHVAFHRPAILRVLLESAVNVNELNSCGATALHLAGRVGDLRAWELLIRAGADTTIKDNEGRLPRLSAVRR